METRIDIDTAIYFFFSVPKRSDKAQPLNSRVVELNSRPVRIKRLHLSMQIQVNKGRNARSGSVTVRIAYGDVWCRFVSGSRKEQYFADNSAQLTLSKVSAEKTHAKYCTDVLSQDECVFHVNFNQIIRVMRSNNLKCSCAVLKIM